EVVQPKPAAHEVLIEVQACGVCHSDLHVANGDWPPIVPITKTPLILGHEIAGRVVEKGNSVNDLEIGDRVGVPWVHWTCGECEFCREGNENLCAKQQITGVTVDGGALALDPLTMEQLPALVDAALLHWAEAGISAGD